MNTTLFLIAIAVFAAFSIAAVVGPDAMTASTAAAQNMTGDNATMMGGGNMTTAGNPTGGNWTK
jgi:hypothetical protein